MITIILPYYNSFKQMPQRTMEYFDMISDYKQHNGLLQLIISDYGSDDGIKEIAKRYRFDYVFTTPNEGQYFNISKCCNNAMQIARNDIIFTNGIDWRYNYSLLNFIEHHFKMLGNMTFEMPIAVLNKENVLEKFIHTTVFLRDNLLKIGGWDERIYNWGQEDHDIKRYLVTYENVPVYNYTLQDPESNIFHLWHETILYDKGGGEERNKKNIEIMTDNLMNERKNQLNSYWEKGELELPK